MIYLASATVFIGELSQGGTSRPWIVEALTANGIQQIVVKPFSNRDENQLKATYKEFAGNTLAKEFDLTVPACYLVTFKADFAHTLPENLRERFRSLGGRKVFGSLYLDGAMAVPPKLRLAKGDYDFWPRLYGFDCLTGNVDRRPDKPNLLRYKKSYVLIDHEQAFTFLTGPTGLPSRAAIDLRLGEIESGQNIRLLRSHIGQNKAKRIFTTSALPAFDEFEEYLGRLNLNSLRTMNGILSENRIDCTFSDHLLYYLQELKRRPFLFTRSLISSL